VEKFGRTARLAALEALIILILEGYLLLSGEYPAQRQTPYPADGMIDLTQFDLNEEIAVLSGKWDFYPASLYTPQELQAGVGEKPQLRTEIGSKKANAIPYGTYTVCLKMQPEQYYEICGWSVDYGMRVYVGDSCTTEVGHVADNAEEVVPRVDYFTSPVYSGQDGTVRIVVQYSNFVHDEGGALQDLYLSSPANIESYKTKSALMSSVLNGGLLFLALLYLTNFCIELRRDSLCFAFCCVLFAFRDQRFYVAQILPWDYDWCIQYRIVLLVLVLIPLALYLLAESLYPRVIQAWTTISFLLADAVLGILMFALPTRQCAHIVTAGYGVGAFFLVLLSVQLVQYFWRRGKIGRPIERTDIILLCGFGELWAALALEAFWQRLIPQITRAGITPIGMVAFVLLMNWVLSIRRREAEAQLEESRRTTHMLEQAGRLRREMLANLSHELRTPLAVISGYAQRARMQIERETAGEEARQGLVEVELEAQRLALLVGRMLDTTPQLSDQVKLEPLQAQDILNRAAALCGPILQKNQNTLKIQAESGCPAVYASMDMVLQILLNLCVNANRHTRKDTLLLTARPEGESVCFSLANHGDAIAPELLSHIFERGFSGDGQSGFGLAICQDAIQVMKGTLATSSSKKETVMCFTLPCAEPEVK
jgi:signal transduction histidine kinase